MLFISGMRDGVRDRPLSGVSIPGDHGEKKYLLVCKDARCSTAIVYIYDRIFFLRDVTFQNRVFTASGTFGYGDEMTDLIDVSAIGRSSQNHSPKTTRRQSAAPCY